jgi:amino acid transporter
MLLETIVVTALSITILVVKSVEPHGINLSAFNVRNASSLSGFWTAMILGVLAFCGFDVVSTAAEEAHAPRKHVPKAILLTVIGIALFWTLNAWAFTLSVAPAEVERYTREGLTAVTPIARAYWGWGDLTVILTAFTGLTAVYISSMQGTSRIVFALARHGLLPKALAQLSGDKRVPHNAVLSALVGVVGLDIASIYLLGNALDSFTWWANALVFFATLTFLTVNVANVLFFWRRARENFRVLGNLLVPIAGAALNAYLIYAAFFSTLWAGDWRSGKSVVAVCVALLAGQICVICCVSVYRPNLLRQPMPIGAAG